MRFSTVSSVLLALVASTMEEDYSCYCENVYKPVCGVDGFTYSNLCELECEGAELHYLGECGDIMNTPITSELGQCSCPLIYDPACGKDGNTYTNVCFVICAGVLLDHKGVCEVTQLKDECKCPFVHLPVCGIDRITYLNACFLLCKGVQLLNQGACRASNVDKIDNYFDVAVCSDQCFCPTAYRPVCGVDGITYKSACCLSCAGVEMKSTGEC